MGDLPVISAPRRRFSALGWTVIVTSIFAGFVLGFLLVSVLVVRAGVWNPFAHLVKDRGMTIDTSSPSVVDKIRQLSRLETVDYSIDKIVEGDRQSSVLPSFLAGDKLLLVAHGEVIAGVDLSQLDKSNVRVDGDTVHVRLPAPQILVTRVDNERTRVYSRTTGLLVPPDPDLESQVRQAAEQEITKAALEDGILEKSRQNARVEITGLLYALGFHTADVQ